jgi:hypothetical protein
MAVGVGGPRTHRSRTFPCTTLRHCRYDDGQRGELLRRRLPLDHSQERALVLTHNGMFPCFFGGRVWRLLASTRSALVTWTRVCEGGITAST